MNLNFISSLSISCTHLYTIIADIFKEKKKNEPHGLVKIACASPKIMDYIIIYK